jgi:hypothetical protein
MALSDRLIKFQHGSSSFSFLFFASNQIIRTNSQANPCEGWRLLIFGPSQLDLREISTVKVSKETGKPVYWTLVQ